MGGIIGRHFHLQGYGFPYINVNNSVLGQCRQGALDAIALAVDVDLHGGCRNGHGGRTYVSDPYDSGYPAGATPGYAHAGGPDGRRPICRPMGGSRGFRYRE